MKKKAILMISHSANKTGGGEWDFQRLLEYFHNQGYYVYSIFPDGYKADYFKKLSDEFLVLPDNIFPFNEFNLRKYLYFSYITIQKFTLLFPFLNRIKNNFDACFVNSSACLSEILALGIMNIPYTLSIKEVIHPAYARKIINSYYRKTSKAVIVISEFIRNIVKDDFKEKEINIIRSSIADDDLAGISRNIPRSDNEFIIVNSGVITPIKNQELLIKAAAGLKTESNVRISFIGRIEDKAYFEKLKTLAKSLPKGNIKIVFEGEVSKKQALNMECNSNLLVVTSKHEGMSLVVAEGLYFRVPVISTRTGVALEVLQDGYNGFLFNENDVNKLTELIDEIIANKELREYISNNQKDSYDKYFSFDYYLKEHERILFQNG